MPLSGDVVAVERVWRRLYSHSEELLTYLLAQSRRLRGRRYHAGVVIRSRANEVVYVADINPSDGVGGHDYAGRTCHASTRRSQRHQYSRRHRDVTLPLTGRTVPAMCRIGFQRRSGSLRPLRGRRSAVSLGSEVDR